MVGGDAPLWRTFYDASFGAIFGALGGNNGQTFYLISDLVRVYGNSTYTISWNGDGGAAPGAVGLYASQFDINGNYIPEGDGLGLTDFVGVNWTSRKSTTFTTRGDCVYLKVVVVKPGFANGSPLNAFVSRIMLNTGAVAVNWSDQATTRQIAASVTEQSLAIIDLENQQALASWNVIANASGGKPARIGLTSSSLGSFVALDAPFIFWGDNTVFDDATDTLQTTVGGYRRVLAFGAPFGSGGTLLEWWGPSSVALGAMTTANGLNGRMTTAPYIFDNVIGVARFQPEADASLRIGTRTSAGLVTTTTVTIAPVGATGAVTYAWSQIGGSEEWTITAPSAGATAFRVNVATPGEQKRATFACRVSDAGTGKTATVIVGAVAIYNV